MHPSPSKTMISPLFTTRKQKLLSALSVPADSYTDLSPKGSVDTGIIDLIDEINGVDGLVTTSSCAGRISVFLEGSKDRGTGSEQAGGGNGGTENGMVVEGKAVPGGKGMGGKWLFVSHDPVEVPEGRGEVLKMFGLREGEGDGMRLGTGDGMGRLVRFQFEPMILHIQTASLTHASPLLSAALNAGFRESGLQSLKALEDPHAFPMVAVRTAGLGLSSVVGIVSGSEDDPRAIVSEDYLRMMLRLGNERFGGNAKRIERFRAELQRAIKARSGNENDKGNGEGENGEWEEKSARTERMRREGLARREAQKQQRQETAQGEDKARNGVTEDGIDGELLLPDG